MSTAEHSTKDSVEQFVDSMYAHQRERADKGKLQTLYDEWENYDEDLGKVNYSGPKFLAEAMAEKIKDKHARILDCGSGSGLVGVELKKLGYTNIDAMDMSQTSLERAKEKNIYIKLVCGDVMDELAKLENNTYDAVLCAGCFGEGHMTSKVFPHWARIIKPGGYAGITLPESYLTEVAAHNEGKLEKVVQELEKEGKWKYLGKFYIERYFSERKGILLAFEII